MRRPSPEITMTESLSESANTLKKSLNGSGLKRLESRYTADGLLGKAYTLTAVVFRFLCLSRAGKIPSIDRYLATVLRATLMPSADSFSAI
jgi:hypothetical protein